MSKLALVHPDDKKFIKLICNQQAIYSQLLETVTKAEAGRKLHTCALLEVRQFARSREAILEKLLAFISLGNATALFGEFAN